MIDRRRFLLTSLAGALARPTVAEPQPQPGKVPRIGYLSPRSASADSTHLKAFREGLRHLGYVEGRDVTIDVRYAEGHLERLPELAAEIVRLKVDVIVTALTPAVRATQNATKTIPIVMAFSGDPVGEHFVAELARPGANITGISAAVPEMAAKRVDLLKIVVPDLTRIAYLAHVTTARQALRETEGAGRTLGVHVSPVLLRNSAELQQAFASLSTPLVQGLVVSLTLRESWRQIVDLAIKNRLPTVSGPREFVEAGGLMAYGPDYADLFRRTAIYVDKILKGARPAQLPVEQPTKFELVINLKTAKALGLTIPPPLLARADQVIE